MFDKNGSPENPQEIKWSQYRGRSTCVVTGQWFVDGLWRFTHEIDAQYGTREFTLNFQCDTTLKATQHGAIYTTWEPGAIYTPWESTQWRLSNCFGCCVFPLWKQLPTIVLSLLVQSSNVYDNSTIRRPTVVLR